MRLHSCLVVIATCYCLVILGSCKGTDALKQGDDAHILPLAGRLFEQFWQWKLRTFPTTGAWLGIPGYETELQDNSYEGYRDILINCQKFYNRATRLLPDISDPSTRRSINEIIYSTKMFIDGFKYQGYYLAINNKRGIQTSLKTILDRMPNATQTDIEHILGRLQKFPSRFEQTIDLLLSGMEERVSLHQVSLDNINTVLDKYIVENPEDSPAYKYFQNEWLPSALNDTSIAKIQSSAKEAVLQVSFSVNKLKRFLEDEYITRTNISISSLKFGKEIYDQCIRFYTLNLTAEEIHQTGLQEVDRLVNEMEKIKNDLGYESMTQKEFSEMLKNDENNFYKTPEELTSGCETLINEVIEPKLKNFFGKFPKNKVRVEEDPLPQASAYYQSGTLDGRIPGMFKIGTSNMKLWPKYVLPSLTLHEANPGHHFQITLNLENERLPTFMKRLSVGASLNNAPSSFPTYSGFTEGWGLYSEFLGLEMGVYRTPLEKYGHYAQDLLRACRLVVDSGMHALGWSREKAINYALDRLPYTRRFIEIQIDRYITWPGQALAYKVGQLQIIRWRTEAEDRLGSHFDIKEFHDAILDNAGSLVSVEKTINTWIDAKEMEMKMASSSNLVRSSWMIVVGIVSVSLNSYI